MESRFLAGGGEGSLENARHQFNGPLLTRVAPSAETAQVDSGVSVSALRPATAPLRELITANVARLVRLDQDTLEVVVRPDAQTQLHLHVAQRDGFVEVRARLESGPATRDGLAAHWAQLQQSLAPQGIRLAPLAEGHSHFLPQPSGTPHFSASSDGEASGFAFQSQSQSRDRGAHDSQSDVAPSRAEQPLPESRHSTPRAGGSQPAWESWA
jgi:hypothetical protein